MKNEIKISKAQQDYKTFKKNMHKNNETQEEFLKRIKKIWDKK